MRQLITNLLTRDVERSAALYRLLCGLPEVRRTDTYVLLAAADGSSAGRALIDWVSKLVPRAARGISEGNYLTLVVDDIEAALAVARDFELEIVEAPQEGGPPDRAVFRDIDGRVVELTTPKAHLVLAPRETAA
jgi:catechol 2,3-dioxygenase-like lactoylglutathione lyase family enzyme